MSSADIQRELTEFLLDRGVSDVGFSKIEGEALPYAVSIAVRLSPAIINEINDEPTHTYFNHYRTVNAFIDRTLLEAGLFLQRKGYDYITVAASQSINMPGKRFEGRLSHKKAACLAGMGNVGKSSLFIHREYGSMVRLGTLLTDFEPVCGEALKEDVCGACRLCIEACPAYAIVENGFDPFACSEYMKNNFQSIGRGAVCGICIKVCPKNGLNTSK